MTDQLGHGDNRADADPWLSNPADVEQDALFPTPSAPAPQTGDDVIDSALVDLERSTASGSLDEQVEAGEKVHRTLQIRLADLGR